MLLLLLLFSFFVFVLAFVICTFALLFHVKFLAKYFSTSAQRAQHQHARVYDCNKYDSSLYCIYILSFFSFCENFAVELFFFSSYFFHFIFEENTKANRLQFMRAKYNYGKCKSEKLRVTNEKSVKERRESQNGRIKKHETATTTSKNSQEMREQTGERARARARTKEFK